MNNKHSKIEVLAPCGDYDILIAAVHAGADACYIGGNSFGARAYATNFDEETIKQAVTYAHLHGVKVYLTVNTLLKQEELPALYEYIQPFYEIGGDALIIQDLGVFSYVREQFPDIAIHCSTQMNITSRYGAEFMKQQGATRVVTAREMSLAEIRAIKEHVDIEVETFVHGAMCYSYSGQCLMSSLAGGRSGNRGRCAQPCRKCYDKSYLLSMKDMCALSLIPKLMDAGIDSLKIEGRMKSVHYVASVVSAYRKAIDLCWQDPEHFTVPQSLRAELDKVSHRPYTTGFALRKTGPEDQVYTTSSYEQTADFVGLVRSFDAPSGRVQVEQRNHVKAGEVLEVLNPAGQVFPWTLEAMEDGEGNPITAAPHAQMLFTAKGDPRMTPFSLIRRLKG